MNGFRCAIYGATLTVNACAKRHRQAGQTGAPTCTLKAIRPCASLCVQCPVGQAHAAGQTPEHWPDGQPVQRVALAVTQEGAAKARGPAKRPKVASRPKTGYKGLPGATVANAAGESRTIREWADSVGMLPPTLRARLNAGLSLERALSTVSNAGRKWRTV